MKKWGYLLGAMLSFASAAQAVDSKYFTIGDVEVRESETVTLNQRMFDAGIGASLCTRANTRFTGAAPVGGGSVLENLGLVDMVLDQVVNIGKKVWTLIEAGKPVVNMKTDVATALPYGARCWMDLQTWEAPKAKTYSVTYKNIYGADVVRFSYRVVYLHGGSVDGKGAYVGYAAIEPSEVYVAWGWSFNAETSTPAVYNMGTKDSPIGGLNLQVNYKIETVFNTIRISRAYSVSGNGQMQALDAQ